jgi:hypothetical protein
MDLFPPSFINVSRSSWNVLCACLVITLAFGSTAFCHALSDLISFSI